MVTLQHLQEFRKTWTCSGTGCDQQTVVKGGNAGIGIPEAIPGE